MIKKFSVKGCGAEISANTCGTAFSKTVNIKVNCEMTIEECTSVIIALTRATEWLQQYPDMKSKCNPHNLGAYEIVIDASFDLKKFEKDSIDRKEGRFWLICTEDQKDFKRFAGTFVRDNFEVVTIRLDIDFTNKTAYTPSSNLELVKEIARELDCEHLFKDGEEISL